MSVTYADYLRLDTLLALQAGVDGDEECLAPAELHFIIVHQIFELGFKLLLRDVRTARDELARGPAADLRTVTRHLARVANGLDASAVNWDLMDALTPQEFLAFRDKLGSASAAQSHQFREFEIVLGLEEAVPGPNGERRPLESLRRAADSSTAARLAWAQVERARREPTLRDVLYGWLAQWPIGLAASPDAEPHDDHLVERFLAGYLTRVKAHHRQAGDAADEFFGALDIVDAERRRHRRLRAALLSLETYADVPSLSWPQTVIATVREIEQSLVQWRRRHARLVEGMIGYRTGTGGSTLHALERAASHRIFAELGLVRTFLLPRTAVPPLTELLQGAMIREAVSPEV